MGKAKVELYHSDLIEKEEQNILREVPESILTLTNCPTQKLHLALSIISGLIKRKRIRKKVRWRYWWDFQNCDVVMLTKSSATAISRQLERYVGLYSMFGFPKPQMFPLVALESTNTF